MNVTDLTNGLIQLVNGENAKHNLSVSQLVEKVLEKKKVFLLLQGQ